jgi:putative molybdopterin biosynthesis protein
MINRLAELRRARGIAAVDLAAQAGVTRQAIYAIEAGTYMPNTVVTLRLAKALETPVEELFALDEEEAAGPAAVGFEPLDEEAPLTPGAPIQICKVGRHTVGVSPALFPAYLPVADGVVTEPGHAAVVAGAEQNRLLVAGCDPALSLLAAHAAEAGVELVLASANSARALEWLRAGRIDIAGTHVNEPRTRGRGLVSVTFAVWEEGFVVARGNPLGIQGAEDLLNPKLRFVNREPGSGSRRLFDDVLRRAGIAEGRVKPAGEIAPGHLAAAWAVASGAADCCIAAGSAARRFGLDFIPLAEERFEFVVHRNDLERKAVATLFDVLSRRRFRRQLETIAGYDVSRAGETAL